MVTILYSFHCITLIDEWWCNPEQQSIKVTLLYKGCSVLRTIVAVSFSLFNLF